MMKTLMIITAVVALAALPTFVMAAPDSAGNGTAGGAVGAGAGGRSGVVVGSGVGGTVGAGSREARDRDDGVVIEQRRVPARQQSCAQDALGNSMCEDIRR